MNSRLLTAIEHSPLWSTRSSLKSDGGRPDRARGVDVIWYLRTHRRMLPGAVSANDCVEHYLNATRHTTVSPNACFDEFWYRSRYPDVVRLINDRGVESGWHHYATAGFAEHRNPTWWFDEAWYQSKHPEVHQAVRTRALVCGFEHYLMYGLSHDLPPSMYFNPAWYKRQYLQDRDVRPIADYLSGKNPDNRCPVPFFDVSWYRSQYLNEGEFTSDPTGRTRSTLEHYVFLGRTLGYSPSPRFNEQAYRAMNPDAAEAIDSGYYASGWEHYVSAGVLNGAAATTHFGSGGLDYAGPRLVEAYEQSMLLNLRQLHRIRQLSER